MFSHSRLKLNADENVRGIQGKKWKEIIQIHFKLKIIMTQTN